RICAARPAGSLVDDLGPLVARPTANGFSRTTAPRRVRNATLVPRLRIRLGSSPRNRGPLVLPPDSRLSPARGRPDPGRSRRRPAAGARRLRHPRLAGHLRPLLRRTMRVSLPLLDRPGLLLHQRSPRRRPSGPGVARARPQPMRGDARRPNAMEPLAASGLAAGINRSGLADPLRASADRDGVLPRRLREARAERPDLDGRHEPAALSDPSRPADRLLARQPAAALRCPLGHDLPLGAHLSTGTLLAAAPLGLRAHGDRLPPGEPARARRRLHVLLAVPASLHRSKAPGPVVASQGHQTGPWTAA